MGILERKFNHIDMTKTEDLHFSKELAEGFTLAFGATKSQRELERLKEAMKDFSAGHYTDALRTLENLTKEAPDIPELQELCGISHYHLGNYKKAVPHLKAFKKLTKTVEQNPVLADCCRAEGDHAETARLYEELAAASPPSPEELLIEGRIVFAGSLADQGDLGAGAKLLQEGMRTGDKTGDKEDQLPKKPSEAEVRQVYALADIYEQAGDIPRARALFKWVTEKDPTGSTDAKERLATI